MEDPQGREHQGVVEQHLQACPVMVIAYDGRSGTDYDELLDTLASTCAADDSAEVAALYAHDDLRVPTTCSTNGPPGSRGRVRGAVFRVGVRHDPNVKNPWPMYDTVIAEVHAASDHVAINADIDLQR